MPLTAERNALHHELSRSAAFPFPCGQIALPPEQS